MPPKKQLQEAPVIFSLRLPVEETAPVPAEPSGPSDYDSVLQQTNYSTILASVEVSRSGDRFNAEMLREILARTKSPTYAPTTACFWCCSTFHWKACVLPISYDAYEMTHTCEGHFCSPECALAYLYNDVQVSDSVRWTRHALLVDMYRKIYTKKDITPAPPRSLLRMFGGQLDIEQYREYLASSDETVAVQLPPLRLHVPTMNVQGPTRDVKKFVTLSDDTVAKASKELRLRRTKPVHSNIQTLDKCFQ